MATVRVRALVRIHGLHFGEEATIALTPMVQLLIDNGKLAVIVDRPAPATPPTSAPVEDPPEAKDPPPSDPPDGDPADPESDPDGDGASRRRRGGRRGEEPSDDEVT